MSNLDRAIAIAVSAHAGQYDKSGHSYILHPLRVMFRFQVEAEMIVAVLHDVVEDSGISLEDLAGHGFSENIIKAIDCLTKRDGEDYEDFISRVYGNDLARKIKIEDIKDNLNLSRLKEVTDRDFQRVKKYCKALEYLLDSSNLKK